MAKGKIKTIYVEKHFGFIATGEPGQDVHFSAKVVRGEIPFDSLQPGDEVEYEAEHKPKGMSAKWVKTQLPASIYRFLNPYNFVRPLTRRKISVSDEESKLLAGLAPPPHDRWVGTSGKIVCELTTQSPLFVADAKWWYATKEDEKNKHKSFHFFQVDSGNGLEPVIPAASLRGMVRSVFEASTNSCFAHFHGEKRLSYRLDASLAPRLVPGRAVKNKETGTWELEIFPGSLQFEPGESPRGICAAGVKRYCAISEEGKIDDTEEERRKIVQLNGLKHGDACYALVERPKYTWVVKKLSKDKGDLHPRYGQKIFRGFLCINNQNIERKHMERFFIAETHQGNVVKRIELADDVVRDYELLLDEIQEYHKRTLEKWREDGHPNLSLPKPKEENGETKYEPAFSRHVLQNDPCLKSGELVYALIEKTQHGPRVKFIGPVAIPRIWYDDAIASRMGSARSKCERIDELCPACRMFGWVEGELEEARQDKCGNQTENSAKTKQSEKDPPAYRGRLQFTHATLQDKKSKCTNATLAILSSPKPTTFRFYLRPQNGKPERKQGARPWEVNWNAAGMEIRGRKFYRHHKIAKKGEFERAGGKRDEQNRTAHEIIGAGARFTFAIRYENLAPVELGALLWSLEMQPDMNHRLGFARPLGFGSVKISIREARIYRYHDRYRDLEETGFEEKTEEMLAAWKKKYVSHFKQAMEQAYGKPFDALENIQDLRALLADSQPDLPIHYPRSSPEPDPEGKNFEWFVGNNRKEGPGYLLPLAPDDDKGMPLLDRQGHVVRA